jgi:myo-inositol 2-dehydrogenase / D-chiro-inositol 1-dehydrogenase
VEQNEEESRSIMVIGLAGAGRIGIFHARVLTANPDVETLYVADIDPARARAAAAEVGGRSVEAPEDLVKAGIDALVIAAATPSHASLIELAAEAGLPAFCEKPIALDLETTDRVLERVERAGILLQIGFQRRFDPGYLAAREAVRSGRLGDLYLVRAAGHDPAPPPDDYVRDSGGIWRDFVLHDFDVIPWATGQEILEVFANGRAYADVFARNDDIHHGAATFQLSGGALGVLTVSRQDPLGYDVRMELFGSRDSVTVGLGDRTPLRSLEPEAEIPGPLYRDFMDRFDGAYHAEMRAFLNAVRGAEPSGCTGAEARRGLLAAMAAERSLVEHRPVRLDEVG